MAIGQRYPMSTREEEGNDAGHARATHAATRRNEHLLHEKFASAADVTARLESLFGRGGRTPGDRISSVGPRRRGCDATVRRFFRPVE